MNPTVLPEVVRGITTRRDENRVLVRSVPCVPGTPRAAPAYVRRDRARPAPYLVSITREVRLTV